MSGEIQNLIQQSKKTDEEIRSLTQQSKKTDEEIRSLTQQSKKTDEEIRTLATHLRRTDLEFNGKWGSFVEALVKGELIRLLGKRDFSVRRYSPYTEAFGNSGETLGEFDIIAVNGEEVVVVEVKTTLTVKKVNEFIEKLPKFKQWFPEYSGMKIYGAIAFLRTYQHSEIYAQRKQLLAIRAVGKGAVILNERGFKGREF